MGFQMAIASNSLTIERFLGICSFDIRGELCLLNSLNLCWQETLQEWIRQGAPEQISDSSFRADYFQFQHIRWLREIRSGIVQGVFGPEVKKISDLCSENTALDGLITAAVPIVPFYEPTIIEENEKTVTLINGAGQTIRILKDNPENMPIFLDWPVKDRASWNEYKKRLDPNTPGRWPSNWENYVQEMNNQTEPLSLEVGGFYGYLREWVGSENILYMVYDDPVLIEDMMDCMLYLETEVIKRTLKHIKIQQATFWEDMCYKAGPLISPDMVKRLMVPRYKKITELLRSYGVEVIFLDSDGNVEELIPLWLEAGINFIWPLEVAAGNDAIAIRKKYGKDLIVGGNLDKRALAKGKRAIHEEVVSKVPFLLKSGGYFPSLDHLVPPDVSFENYRYFINTLRKVGGFDELLE
jgi:uroporphyrinogen decarboxylase